MRTALKFYRWACEYEAPGWITAPAVALSVAAILVLVDAIEVTMK